MNLNDLTATAILITYYALVCGLVPALLKRLSRTPAELVRKIQHVGYSLSVLLLLNLFTTWYAAIAGALALVLVAYPALWFMENLSWYRDAFVDRAVVGGELRKSLVQVQVTIIILLFVFWGVLGERWTPIIVVAAMAWGFGDAAAALVGKAWGRRHVISRFVDRAKTYEGTAAMMVVAGTALFWSLRFSAGESWPASLLIAAIVAPVCGVTELLSRRGTDTMTVPLTTAFVLLPLMHWLNF